MLHENIPIEIKNLTFSYKNNIVLDIPFLKVNSGKIVGLLGPNGAGKTTLIKILTGFLSIPSKKVKIMGVDVQKNAKIKNKIGVMPQENNLYVNMSALNNLKLHGYLFNIPKQEMNTLIEKWLKKVGLWERRNENIKHFSGGMQRRVTFVRSVLHNPNILFFDEPTTGLDIQTRIEMWKWIKELKDLGKLVFLTTHYIEEAEKLCDEVIIIDHGKVLDQDSPSNCRDKYVSKAIMELSSSASLEILQKSLPNYKISEVTNESFIIRMNKLSDANTILDSLTNQNIDFTNFSSKETTLEEAFIELTGRRIRS